MNIKLLTLFCAITITTLHACTEHVDSSKDGNNTITINFNGSSCSTLSQNNALNQQAHHSSNQSTDITTIATITSDLEKKLSDYYQHGQNASVNCINWIQNNRLKTISITCISFYIWLTHQLYQANIIINDPHAWSNWHNGRSLNDLFATSQNTLESDLLFAIQTRYVHPTNPTDFIYSIVQASNALQAEIQILNEQINRYVWIDRCRSLQLFFLTPQDTEALQEKLRKLLFLKHIFSSWCANYKIDKNN